MSTKPLASAIVTLRIALEGVEADDANEANQIFAAVDAAWLSPTPEKVLNAHFGQLRRYRPGIFFRLNRWLNRVEVQSAASKAGAYWAWRIWRRATVMMHRKTLRASVAFGMNRNGRPPAQGFTRAEDAACYAIHLVKTGGATDESTAIQTAATLYRARIDQITKALPLARALPSADIACMAADSKGKRI